MELFWPLLTVRWLHLSLLLALFGSALFAIYNRPPGGGHQAVSCEVAGRRFGAWMALAALASGLCWVGLSLLDASEDVASLISPTWWQTYLIETSFGHIWMLRLAGLVALLSCLHGWPRSQGPPAGLIAGLSAGLIASLAWLGHAAADRGPQLFAGLFAYGCHALAAAAWLGGLLPLGILLSRARAARDLDDLRPLLERFSRLGTLAVTLILASGLVSAGLRTQGFANLLQTTYGNVLLCKIALFAVLLALAATNRFVFLARLRRPGEATSLRALSRSVLLEQFIGVSIVGLAAVLSSDRKSV